jgi:alkylation response protein AidB-like acyl-CoA dehydrogenase
VDFRLGEKSDAFRAEVREFLEQAMTPELDERLYRSGVSHDDEFTQKLVERGWLGSNWPAEYGGQERSAYEVVAFRQETSKVASDRRQRANASA